MALITAKATGNWSAGSTWDSDPALPAAGDTVDCAGYTVTINQDVTVVQLKSTGAGYFSVATAPRSIAAAVLSDTGSSGTGVVRCTIQRRHGRADGGTNATWTALRRLAIMTLPIALMYLAIGICAVLAVAGIAAIVLVERAERGR